MSHTENGPDLARGTITGHAANLTATFTPAHRVGNPSRPILECTITMPLSLDDVAGALLAAGGVGVLREDVTDFEDLHAVVVFMLVNHNREVAAARKRLTAPELGTPEWEEVTTARSAALRLYGNHPENRARFGTHPTQRLRTNRPLRAVPDHRTD